MGRLLILLMLISIPVQASAYVDPGTISYVISGIMAAATMGITYFVVMLQKFKARKEAKRRKKLADKQAKKQ